MSLHVFAQRIFLVLTDFDGAAPANGCEPSLDFDDAVDAYAEQMGEGRESRVYVVRPALNAIVDVTADAAAHLGQRLTSRGDDWPAWLRKATDTEVAA